MFFGAAILTGLAGSLIEGNHNPDETTSAILIMLLAAFAAAKKFEQASNDLARLSLRTRILANWLNSRSA